MFEQQSFSNGLRGDFTLSMDGDSPKATTETRDSREALAISLQPQEQILQAQTQPKNKGWDDFLTWWCGTSRHSREVSLNVSSVKISSNINVALASTTPICSPPPPIIHPKYTAITDAGASGIYMNTDSPCSYRNTNVLPIVFGVRNRTHTQVSVVLHHTYPATTLSPVTHHADL